MDAIIAFAGAGQRRRLFRIQDILTVNWAAGYVPEECRFLLNTQRMFLIERDPASKIFDDDEWMRSLAEAQTIIQDIPEERITHDQSDPKKVGPVQMEFLRQWRGGNTEPCPLWSKTEFNRCLKIVAQSKVMLTVPENAVWL